MVDLGYLYAAGKGSNKTTPLSSGPQAGRRDGASLGAHSV
jgi:hypothetical protein